MNIYSSFSNAGQVQQAQKAKSSPDTKLQFSGMPKLPAGSLDSFEQTIKGVTGAKVFRNTNWCSG